MQQLHKDDDDYTDLNKKSIQKSKLGKFCVLRQNSLGTNFTLGPVFLVLSCCNGPLLP